MTKPKPTEQQVKRHWKAQETSVFRKPHIPDAGVAIIESPQHMMEVIEGEIEQGPQQLLKRKSSAVTLEDPMQRAQRLIQQSKNMDSEEFMAKLVQEPADLQLWLIRYGNMKDSQRSTALKQYRDQLYREHKDVQDRNDRLNREEQRAKEKMLQAMRVLEATSQKKDAAK